MLEETVLTWLHEQVTQSVGSTNNHQDDIIEQCLS